MNSHTYVLIANGKKYTCLKQGIAETRENKIVRVSDPCTRTIYIATGTEFRQARLSALPQNLHLLAG